MYISAADSMGLHLLFSHNYASNSNPLKLKLLVRKKVRVLREIATQGHSRSFILQSVTGQQGVAYRHIILVALSLKFPKK